MKELLQQTKTKQLLLLISFLLFGFLNFGQDKKDPEVLHFISSKNQHIQLTGTEITTKKINKYRQLISDYLSNKNIDPSYYFISKDSFQKDKNSISITLLHYDGFSKKRKGQHVIGNASGKDGIIKIDIKNNTIISFLRYK